MTTNLSDLWHNWQPQPLGQAKMDLSTATSLSGMGLFSSTSLPPTHKPLTKLALSSAMSQLLTVSQRMRLLRFPQVQCLHQARLEFDFFRSVRGTTSSWLRLRLDAHGFDIRIHSCPVGNPFSPLHVSTHRSLSLSAIPNHAVLITLSGVEHHTRFCFVFDFCCFCYPILCFGQEL